MKEHRVAVTIGFACFALAFISNKKSRVPPSKHKILANTLQAAVKIGKEFYMQVCVLFCNLLNRCLYVRGCKNDTLSPRQNEIYRILMPAPPPRSGKRLPTAEWNRSKKHISPPWTRWKNCFRTASNAWNCATLSMKQFPS